METIITGKAFVYGANIDTDQIYPGAYLDLTDYERVAEHAMERIDPNFIKEVTAGDLIVATTNFGCGSSREHAAITLKAAGIRVVIAESFGRIFYRNAINLGLPLLVCPGIAKMVTRGEQLRVNLQTGLITNLNNGKTATAEPLSPYVLTILEHGGIKPMMRKRQGLDR